MASLLANDTDPDSGDIIRITSVTRARKGSCASTMAARRSNPADDTLTYTANGNVLDTLGVGETTTDTFTYTVSDGHGSTDTATVTVTINGVNDAPVIDLNGALAGPGATLNYSTGAAATAIAPSGTVTDVDYSNSGDFNGGTLTVAFTANGSATDQLTIQNQGVGAGQIGVSGSNVTFGGTTIGTFSGGTNGSNLVVTFNASSTPAAAQALLEHIQYSNATSPTVAKTLTYTLVDGDGTANGGTDTGSATATINVTGGDTTPPTLHHRRRPKETTTSPAR